MKVPNTTFTIILLAIPSLIMFVTGLGKEHLITASVADVILLLLTTVLKTMQEAKAQTQETIVSRSIDSFQTPSTPSLVYRVLFN